VAAYNGYKEVAKLLLDKKTDVKVKGDEYDNALEAALARGYKQM
jgi:ankyrin repeat protein